MLLEGKSAIVTGGGKGIGKAIALALAREGADVVIAARTESELKEVASEIKGIGRKSLAVVTDLADPLQPQTMVEKAIKEFGKIDILVNNSGVAGPIMNVWEMDVEAWNQMMAVNLTGAMLCTKFVIAKSMMPRKSGAIVNISSGAGRGGPPTRSAYASSKAGIIALTRSTASEAGKFGIRANCISPGFVSGERIERIMRETSKNTGKTYDEVVQGVVGKTPIPRFVKPEEIAALAVFLCSDMSSAITGQTINCDAGMRMD